MKYIKLYEWFGKQHPDYGWKNITIEGDKMCVYVYELANEMERAVIGKAKYKVSMMESQCMRLITDLLIGKVVSFETDDGEFTGICKKVEFESGRYGTNDEKDDDVFNIQYVFINLENQKNAGSSSLEGDNDKVIVHLDIDPEVYRDAKKYNL